MCICMYMYMHIVASYVTHSFTPASLTPPPPPNFSTQRDDNLYMYTQCTIA